MYPTKKLSEISNFYKKGILPKEGQFYNYVGLENIESHTGRLIDFSETEGLKIKSNKVEFKKGMVLYGKLRPYLNKVLIVEFDGVATTEILPIECSKELLNTYLSYFLRTPSFVALANSNISGARMPRVSPKFLKEEVEIPLPPLSTQSRIVAKLDEAFGNIDKQIELLKGNIEDVENMKKSLLDESFQNGEYEFSKLGEVCHFVRGPFGGSLKKEIFKESGYAIYEQMHAIYNDYNTVRYFIDEEKFAEMKRFELCSGSLIMSCSGTMGKISIVPENIAKGIINQALLALTPKNSIFNKYLKNYMESSLFQKEIQKYAKGAAIQNVASVKILKEIQIPLPSLPRQHEIVAHLDAVFDKTRVLRSEYEDQIRDLEIMRQSLLSEAFAGRLVSE